MPTQPPLDPNHVSEIDLLIAFTRLEGKVDAALAQHGANLATHGRELADHEARLRSLETRPSVAPRTLWTVTASAVALILAAGPVIVRLFGTA